jgi:hypothetical protein
MVGEKLRADLNPLSAFMMMIGGAPGIALAMTVLSSGFAVVDAPQRLPLSLRAWRS